MNTTQEGVAPLVFYVELLRRHQGEKSMTQQQLAEISGVNRRTLARYETARALPRTVEDLIALAYALGLPSIEALIAPERREAILSEVDVRRAANGLSPIRPLGDRGRVQ